VNRPPATQTQEPPRCWPCAERAAAPAPRATRFDPTAAPARASARAARIRPAIWGKSARTVPASVIQRAVRVAAHPMGRPVAPATSTPNAAREVSAARAARAARPAATVAAATARQRPAADAALDRHACW